MTKKLVIPAISLCLTIGSCALKGPELSYCEGSEGLRLFTPEEIAVRSEKWPDNLAKDYRDNLTWERVCS